MFQLVSPDGWSGFALTAAFAEGNVRSL
jgi:hypothetical protein